MFWLKKFISFWLMPLPFCLTLLVAGLALSMGNRRPRLGRALLAAATLLLLLFGNKAVSNRLLRPLELEYPAIPELGAGTPVPKAIAACRFVVVLGGGNSNAAGLSATNRLSTSSLGRLVEAVRLLRAIPGARLIVNGPGEAGRPSHASQLARAAESLGVAASRITLIETVHDTEDESRSVHRIVGSAPIALVTSAWHMPRAALLFQKAGVTFVPCPADFVAPPEAGFEWTDLLWDSESIERSTLAVHERLGILWTRLPRFH